jgi:hypothetical protein
MAIVPQLVPVAKEITQATTKRIGGNQQGETLPASTLIKNSPVPRLSQQFFSDQARISITDGTAALLMPR